MNTMEDQPSDLGDAPLPRVRTARHISVIWLVPVIAALIGIGLAIKTISEKGPTIVIHFASAEGLEAGKTRIKYKDVDVGRVEAIQLDKDLSQVKVIAEMVPEIGPYLTANTRFWIVRARVSAGEVSGLATLFSGVYIGMDPGRQGEEKRIFRGLEIPPVVTLDMPGRYFNLRAKNLGSLDTGSPIYFRQIKVGQVVRYQIQPKGTAVEVQIFIRSPYDRQVNQNTRFWNASGLDFRLDTTGVHIKTESLLTLIEGGIAFETPSYLDQGAAVSEGHAFTLYDSYEQIDEPTYARKFFFIAYFHETVRGLSVGAPVEFRGIKIGEVINFKLEFNRAEASVQIPVLCAVELDRIEVKGKGGNDKEPSREEQIAILRRLIQKGLRAQLRTGTLLTGQLYINLGIFPDAVPAKLHYAGSYPVLPTVPEPVQEIASSLAKLLGRLETLPIEQIGHDLGDSVRHAKQLLGSRDLASAIVALNKSMEQIQRFTTHLNADLTPQMADLLKQTSQAMASGQKALSAAEKVLRTDSPLTYDLQETLKELGKAARAVSRLADLLERNPQALIYGNGATP